MRVLMKTLSASPDGTLLPDHVYNLPHGRAEPLIAGGYAEPVDRAGQPIRQPAPPPVPVDTAPASDTAPAAPDQNPGRVEVLEARVAELQAELRELLEEKLDDGQAPKPDSTPPQAEPADTPPAAPPPSAADTSEPPTPRPRGGRRPRPAPATPVTPADPG